MAVSSLGVEAANPAYVLAAGAQTIGGTKTFATQPVMLPAPVTLPLASGWTTVANTMAPIYWRDAQGIVHLNGVIMNTSSFSPSGQTLATLPTGFRALASFHTCPILNSYNIVQLDISAAGVITCSRSSLGVIPSSTQFALSIHFPGS